LGLVCILAVAIPSMLLFDCFAFACYFLTAEVCFLPVIIGFIAFPARIAGFISRFKLEAL